MLIGVAGPVFDERAEMAISDASNTQGQANEDSRSATPKPLDLTPHRQPLSPKSLAPLIIPTSSAPRPRLAEQGSKGDETPGPDVPPKSARMLEFSPSLKRSAFKSPSATTLLANPSSDTIENSPLPSQSQPTQPNSAPSGRGSPQSWSATANLPAYISARSQTPGGEHVFTHRRGASEGGASIMDRGRPKLRINDSPPKRKHSKSVTESSSEERKAFESLPQGSSPAVASVSMSTDEIATLRKQAIGQASRFSVLSPKDVDILSRVSLLSRNLYPARPYTDNHKGTTRP
jgi:hypothetical protein